MTMDIQKIMNHLTYPYMLLITYYSYPLTTKKFDGENTHPALTPIDCNIFDCCASCIKEEFEDWDLKFVEVKPEIKKIIKQPTDDTCSEFDEDDNNLYRKIKNVIKRLSKTRSDGFDSWIRVCWAIEILD
jgi:hypothetical protein